MFNHIQNKYLIAEIWEIEAILVWILATQIEHEILRYVLIGWGIINIGTGLMLKAIHRKEYEDRTAN